MLERLRARAPRTMRFCTILALCGAGLIVVGCLSVLVVPAVPLSASAHHGLSYAMAFIAAAGFLPIYLVVFILWTVYEEDQWARIDEQLAQQRAVRDAKWATLEKEAREQRQS